ncbi:L-aspartate oxidase [Glutamicibacter sp. MNS18]|uniref:L-aspartate oxidase n=1 Tax=Glutamicibacter sp. MNS18 TaxID=2989817 RepID=UPI00223674EC|nr:L-aspartate oxidase [Glutamicibacter sp. MNS18]MCW4467198.1 L-aspartate oxidase [Glutamicibacter sp. MNS18]
MSGTLLIIGSGAAGILAALEAAARGAHPVLVTKDALGAGNTGYAQGGISALTPLGVARGDSVQAHVADTLAAGAGHCSPAAVATLCQDAPELVTRLERLGVHFDRDARDDYQLGLEAAHSAHRILHIDGDATGAGLILALAAACHRQHRAGALEIIDHALVTGLRSREGRISAVAYLRAGRNHVMEAHTVLLATGGIGSLYQTSTNPAGATGDGIALAARAGAVIADMEFVQFHPTMVDTVVHPGAGMISEAVRGEGAWLVNDAGQRFMPGIDERAELAPRDVIARAIHARNLAGQQVYLDARHLETEHGNGFLARRFPSITGRLATCGLDLATDPVPVKPAQHYLMGGILTDLDGRTTVPGLYAAGECANSLVHGANRLASNSLLDAMVFARRAVTAMLYDAPEATAHTAGDPVTELPAAQPNGPLGLADLQHLATETLAVHRTGEKLRETITRLQDSSPVASETRGQVELENLLLLARMIAHAALHRTHSLGAHHRTDHPEARTAPRTLWRLAASEQNHHTEEAKEIYA